MKNQTILLTLMLLQVITAKAQTLPGGVCDFESDCEFLQPLADTNIWEVNVPHKTFLDSARTLYNCLITGADSALSTNVNDYAQFDFCVGGPDYDKPNLVDISFYYKTDLSLNNDFCDILVAFDSSAYHNIQYWSEYAGVDQYFEYAAYDVPDYQIIDGDTGITGQSSADYWQYGYFQFIFHFVVEPIEENDFIETDTMHVRFQLHTDSIADGGDGLAIDDLEYYAEKWSGIEAQSAIETMYMYPNPVQQSVTLHCEKLKGTRQQVKLRTITGQQMNCDDYFYFDQSGDARLNLSQLPAGTYICTAGGSELLYRGVLIKL